MSAYKIFISSLGDVKEWCEREQDGQRVFTAALNNYQALDQFEQLLEKLLVGKLNERFPDRSGPELKSLRPPAPTWPRRFCRRCGS